MTLIYGCMIWTLKKALFEVWGLGDQVVLSEHLGSEPLIIYI